MAEYDSEDENWSGSDVEIHQEEHYWKKVSYMRLYELCKKNWDGALSEEQVDTITEHLQNYEFDPRYRHTAVVLQNPEIKPETKVETDDEKVEEPPTLFEQVTSMHPNLDVVGAVHIDEGEFGLTAFYMRERKIRFTLYNIALTKTLTLNWHLLPKGELPQTLMFELGYCSDNDARFCRNLGLFPPY